MTTSRRLADGQLGGRELPVRFGWRKLSKLLLVETRRVYANLRLPARATRHRAARESDQLVAHGVAIHVAADLLDDPCQFRPQDRLAWTTKPEDQPPDHAEAARQLLVLMRMSPEETVVAIT